jgi:SAM-dependent methyltransferase
VAAASGGEGGTAEVAVRKDWDAESARLAARALRAGEPTAWFEELYAAGRRREIDMPWDRPSPLPLLADWLQLRAWDDNRSGVVVGCGLGIDAEYIAANGFQTTAFDISETAVRTATERYPNSPVSYCRADLLSVPSAWLRAFDLVVEIITIRALPLAVRPQAVAAVASLVAAGGTLLAIENVRQDSDPMPDRPPWPFSRPEIESFAENGLETVAIDQNIDPVRGPRWRAEFTCHMP